MLDELETEVIEAIHSIIWDNILENGISLIMRFAASLKSCLSVFNLGKKLIKLILESLGGCSLLNILIIGEATLATLIILL